MYALVVVTIPKLKFSEPRHNLPGRKGVATREDRFTIGFARAYGEQFTDIHARSARSESACAREIPVNGYGIADLMVVAWEPGIGQADSVESFLKSGVVTTRTFECKITDWRSALTQALRYRYFAHQSIVVLPPEACARAARYLDTFRKTKIGLWSFDPNEGRITAHHTPRAATPKSERYHVHAVELVHRATRQALPIG